MDVADWLRMIGLEQYEATFRENAVSVEVLPHLTAEDLKELGIVAVGHRRELLVAIAALAAGSPVQSSPSPTNLIEDFGPSEPIAERRQLSIMFCDLIGSTALSSRLDPEDLREVIRTYQACVVSSVHQFHGFVARYVGDGVLIYFGWPEAGETDG
jgi:class 3 adenylate cyclase